MLKEDGRKPGETDKTITSQGGRLSPKLSELGIDKKISSLSQRIADLTNELTIAGRFCKTLQNLFIWERE